MPGYNQQNLPQSLIEELQLREEKEKPDWDKVRKEAELSGMSFHKYTETEKGNRVQPQVIKNEQANKDNANVTTAEDFSNASKAWHEIFNFCLANGMERIEEQYPEELHNTGIKRVKLFIHHLIGVKSKI